MEIFDLSGKTAVVTGAAQGIGRAIAEKLASAGAHVFILDYNGAAAEATAAEIRAAGYQCSAVACDVSDVPGTRAVIEGIIAQAGRIDVLVNNAGITQKMELLEITEEVWDRTFNINLRGLFFLTQKVFENMKDNGGGRIVNMTSLSALRGARFSSVAYTSSKGGVMSLTKCLALLGSSYGICVNGVAPGVIETAMAKTLGFNVSDVPLGRTGTPDEVADTVLFLCSDRARYITGSILDVNGGQLMR